MSLFQNKNVHSAISDHAGAKGDPGDTCSNNDSLRLSRRWLLLLRNSSKESSLDSFRSRKQLSLG
jgi:hypothetical protein